MGGVMCGGSVYVAQPHTGIKNSQRTLKRARVLSWVELMHFFLGTMDTQRHYSKHIIETGNHSCIVIQLHVAIAVLC